VVEESKKDSLSTDFNSSVHFNPWKLQLDIKMRLRSLFKKSCKYFTVDCKISPREIKVETAQD